MKNDYKIKKFKSNDPDGASFWKLIHPIGKTGGILCGVWEEINCPIAASYVIKMPHINRGAFMIDDDQSTSFFGRKPGWGHC